MTNANSNLSSHLNEPRKHQGIEGSQYVRPTLVNIELLPDGRISMKDAAKYVGMTYGRFRNSYRDKYKIPHFKIGRLVFFL